MRNLQIISLQIIFAVFLGGYAFGQNNGVSKKEILENFKIEKHYHDKKWYSCNKNGLFSKADTISFYDNWNYFSQSESCCELICWKFYMQKSFVEVKEQFCKEPTSALVSTEKDYYTIELEEKDKRIFLNKYFHNNLVDSFIVYSLTEIDLPEKIDKCKELILIRKK